MAIHAVITFLEDQKSLKVVDSEFRKLVVLFHLIPFCASFGVSCAGHFEETDSDDEWHPDSFEPSPWGHLDIIVLSTMPHIQELLKMLGRVINSYEDVSFKKIKHVFGPPDNSQLEVWEIRIGDNGCMDKLEEEGHWFGDYLFKKGNEVEYEVTKKRNGEIQSFWKDLEKEVLIFCQKYGFKKFDLEKRVKEIVSIWKTEVNNK